MFDDDGAKLGAFPSRGPRLAPHGAQSKSGADRHGSRLRVPGEEGAGDRGLASTSADETAADHRRRLPPLNLARRRGRVLLLRRPSNRQTSSTFSAASPNFTLMLPMGAVRQGCLEPPWAWVSP